MTEPLPGPAGSARAPAALVARFAGRTDTGLQREHNEDRLLLQELGGEPSEASGEHVVELSSAVVLLAVSDGMGGAVAGEVAAKVSVDTLAGRARTGVDGSVDPDQLERWLVEGVLEANQSVHRRSLEEPALEGMGCTLTAALLGPRGLVVAHVGDSRGYLLRGGELRRVTDDHTLVGRLVALGRITEEAARRHEQRHLLLEAVGGARDPDIDRRVLALAAGDRLLLCSDGLTDLVSDREIGDLLAGDGDPPAQCERLVELANGRGGVDNVTVVVVHLD